MRRQYIIFLVPVSITLLAIFFFALAGLKEGPNTRESETKKQTQEKKSQEQFIVNDLDPSVGPHDAKVIVVEFVDFQCPYCRASHEAVTDAMKHYANLSVRFVFRQLPIFTKHPYALQASNAALCAGEQKKYIEMQDLFFMRQEQIQPAIYTQYAQELGLDLTSFNTRLAEKKYQPIIQKDLADAESLQVNATPTWFINTERIVGALTKEELQSAIDTHLGR